MAGLDVISFSAALSACVTRWQQRALSACVTRWQQRAAVSLGPHVISFSAAVMANRRALRLRPAWQVGLNVISFSAAIS
eukprot:222857-Karenia_brevis.AAC.1